MKHTKEEAARSVLLTLPQLMQAVASELRHSEHAVPMPQFGTLMMLSRGPCTLSELAEHRKVSAPTMSKTIDILEGNGWVGRSADPTDRRKTELHLTDSGTEVVKHAEERIVVLLARFLEPLDQKDLDALTAGMDVLKSVAERVLPQDEPTAEPTE